MSAGSHHSSMKQLYIILVATFLFGCAAGVILYLQNNTGNEGDGALHTSTKGFTVQAYMYGGCERAGACPSYRIANDGTFVFIERRVGQEDMKYEDALTTKQLEVLRTQLADTDFIALMNTKFAGTCPADTDGIAYRFEIEYKGERHNFDSCVEQITGNQLMELLKEYFSIFQTMRKTA